VGAAARDLDRGDRRGWRLGGTVMYASLAAARIGVPVRALIGADRDASTAHEVELLRAAEVDVEIVRLERGPMFANEQAPAGRRLQIGHQASDPMPLTALPAAWRSTSAVLLGPVAGEIGPDWAEVSPGALLALAWQGLLRQIVPGEQVRRTPLVRNELVRRADLLMLSRDDISAGGERLDELIRDGQQLVVTHGRRGAVSLHRTGSRISGRFAPALEPRATVDETGAGDVFLAALCAGRLLPGMPATIDEWRLLALAAAAASVSVEGRGLEAIPDRKAVCAALLRLRDAHPRGGASGS
jgi:sugar/nucleoside kinase (ribokinase family)